MGVTDNQRAATYRLRHVAGPNAGGTNDLPLGTHEFGLQTGPVDAAAPAPNHVAFTIDVTEGTLELTPMLLPQHAHLLTVDDEIVEHNITITHGQAVALANDIFIVEDRHADRPTPVSSEVVVAPLPDEPKATPSWVLPAALLVLLLGLLWVSFKNFAAWPVILPGAAAVFTAWWLHRGERRAWHKHENHQRGRAERFRLDLIEEGRTQGIRRRDLSIGTDRLLDAARSGTTIAADAPIAVAYGEAQWQPDLDVRGAIDQFIEHELDLHARLHGVPLGLDVANHLVGIVGPRATGLAVARHLVSAVALRPERPQFSFELSPTAAADWTAAADLVTPSDEGNGRYVVSDGEVGSTRPAAGVLLSATSAGLRHSPDVLITIAADGFATLKITASGRQSGRMAPVGISAERFRQILHPTPLASSAATAPIITKAPQTLPQEPTREPAAANRPTNPILITAPSPDLSRGQLTALALNATRQPEGSQSPLVLILDRPDGSLSGLAELAADIRLFQAAETQSVQMALAECAIAFGENRPIVFLADDLGSSLHHLASHGHKDLANQIVTVLRACNQGRGLAAVAEPSQSRLPAALARRFPVRIEHHDGQPWLINAEGRRPLKRRSLAPEQVAVVVRRTRSDAPVAGSEFRG